MSAGSCGSENSKCKDVMLNTPSDLLPVQEATGHLLVKRSFTHFLCEEFVPL